MASQHLIGIALQQLLPGALAAAEQLAALDGTGAVAHAALKPALGFLRSRFTDQSALLTAALERATDRAWRALELVVAGDSLWDRLKGALAPADMKAFRHDVRGLLAAAGVRDGYPVDHRAAARDLRAARAAGALRPTGLTPAGMVQSVGVFARFDDPAELAAAQWRAADAIAAELKTLGYPALAAVAAFRPNADSVPLLGVAVRYFFRRAVEQDPELARGLTFARLEGLAEAQSAQFHALDRLVTEQGDRIDAALGELAADVAEVKALTLDIRAEQDRLGDANRQVMEAVLAIQAQLDQAGRTAARPRDSLSVRSDVERQLVRQVIAQFRGLPEADRTARPALRNAVGLLEVAAGEFAAARSDFAAAAESVADPKAKGIAHVNGYRAALEARDWAGALRELLAAAKCDGPRLAPFPLGRYIPKRILGAGGFGVAFLCKHKYMGAEIVVKTLIGNSSDQDFDALFAEARAAAAVPHPGIVRVTDCGYVDPSTKDRPFVVMDYFPGPSLDQYVREQGAIPPERLMSLARDLAGALGAAHGNGILHRDVKPGNVLVRPDGDRFEVRMIDFGLAVRHKPAEGHASTSRSAKTLIGESIAGTVEYAAPEQMGRGGGAGVGPYSDVYGWAKTCCFALFQTAQPTLRHWRAVPAGLGELLGRCLEEEPKNRPQSFAAVVAALDKLDLSKQPEPNESQGSRPAPVGAVVLEPAPRRKRAVRDEDKDEEADDRRGARRERLKPRRRDRTKQDLTPMWVLLGLCAVLVVIGLLVVGLRKKGSEANAESASAVPSAPATALSTNTGRAGGDPPPPVTPAVPAPQSVFAPPVAPALPAVPARPGVPGLPSGLKELRVEGGFMGPKDFRDLRQDGSYVIGFEVGQSMYADHEIVTALRPIWRTPTGEEMGTAYGRSTKPTTVVKAKPGYALGGVVIAGGGLMEGIAFTFMRLEGDAMDRNDAYTSDWYGRGLRKPSPQGMKAGDGSRVVGFYGKRFEDKGGNKYDDNGSICSLGLIVVPTSPKRTW